MNNTNFDWRLSKSEILSLSNYKPKLRFGPVLTSSEYSFLGGLTIDGNKLSNLELSAPGSSNSYIKIHRIARDVHVVVVLVFDIFTKLIPAKVNNTHPFGRIKHAQI